MRREVVVMGYTVEQKNYRALIAGTSLETETRE